MDVTEESPKKTGKLHKQFIDRSIQATLEYNHFLIVGDEKQGTLVQYAGQFDRSERVKTHKFPNGKVAIDQRKSAVRTLQLFEDTPYYLQDIKGTVGFPDETIENRRCHHIVIYSSAAYVETHLWIDKENFLLRKMQQPVHAVLKPALSLLRHAPFKLGDFLGSDIRGDEMNMHTEFIVLEAELNPDIDPFVFDLSD